MKDIYDVKIIFCAVLLQLHTNIENINGRRLCHQKIYLLEKLGVDLGFCDFSFWIRPYSHSLNIFLDENFYFYQGLESIRSVNILPEVNEKITLINQLQNEKTKDINTFDWYELLASYLYIYLHSISWNIKNTNEHIYQELRALNSKFTQSQCKTACRVLMKYSFIKN